jgi:iron complex transport system ATP-binding protein
MTDVIRVVGASLERAGTQILRDVTWSVRSGERWVVLGPNGAGKTSLLGLLAARAHPGTGSVEVLGLGVADATIQEVRVRVGLSSDALAARIFPHELVRDVVLTAAYGVTGRRLEDYETVDLERAVALLDAFGLGGLVTREFGTLSEGERKRTQLARSLMSNPEILLLDEPAAGLDLGGREELRDALTRLAADPHSPVLVLVTHHVEEIPEGFDHALILTAGAVLATGRIQTVLTARNLSSAFGMAIDLQHSGGRWSAHRSEGSTPSTVK